MVYGVKEKETELQASIVEALQLGYANRGSIVMGDTSVQAVRTQDGSWRSLGNAGTADLTLCVNGRYVAMEVKTSSGRLALRQKFFKEALEQAGGVYVVVRSPQEALAAVANVLKGRQSDVRV